MANNYTIVDATEQTTLSAEDIGSSVKVPIVRGTGYLPAVYVTVTRPADTNLQRVLAHIRQAAVRPMAVLF